MGVLFGPENHPMGPNKSPKAPQSGHFEYLAMWGWTWWPIGCDSCLVVEIRLVVQCMGSIWIMVLYGFIWILYQIISIHFTIGRFTGRQFSSQNPSIPGINLARILVNKGAEESWRLPSPFQESIPADGQCHSEAWEHSDAAADSHLSCAPLSSEQDLSSETWARWSVVHPHWHDA